MPAKEIRAARKIMHELSPSSKRDLCQILPKVSSEYAREMQGELNRQRPDPARLAMIANEMVFTERIRVFCPPEGRGGNPIRRDRYGDRGHY